MLDYAYKSIMRQKTRSFLTILGITIGIAAIVALGSIAEGIDASIQSNLELAAGKIIVTEANTGMMGASSSLSDSDLEAISSLSGIKEVVPVIVYYELGGFSAPQYIVVGIDPEKSQFIAGENTKISEGREIDEGERDVALIGDSVATLFDLEPGDYFTVKESEFEIVGVLESTGISDIDTAVIVPIQDLQLTLNRDDYQMFYVIPDDVADTEVISDNIEDLDEKYSALSSKEFASQAASIVDQIRVFTFGIGAIAAFVGGLGVMNTMIMAVMERRKEIGVMKAIGATNGMILRQILTESAMISFMGGVAGLILGTIGSLAIGLLLPVGGRFTGVVTPSLALTGVGFAVFLGVIGGYYPARKASQLDPVEALRYE